MNLRELTDPELRKLRADAAKEETRRRKAKRPKVRQVKSAEERERARAYVAFREEHAAGGCWACGRTEDDRPTWWHGPWLIERMHFVHSGMGCVVRDPRLIIAACSGCHGQYHKSIANWGLPPLTDENCAWLKREHGDYDPLFIARNNTRGSIQPVRPSQAFFLSRQRFIHFGKGNQ